MEKFNYGLEQLYVYAQGVYHRGPSHVCTKEFTETFPKLKLEKPAFVAAKALPEPEFIADGLPPQYHGKQTYTRVDRNIYRPRR